MNRITLIFVLTILLTVAAPAQNSVKVGMAAPVFSEASLDGTNYDLSALRGSIVVITFWSTKCEICRNEIPKLNHFTEQFDSKKVVFLALTMEQPDKIAGYLKQNPFKFKIVPDSFGVVMQYADRDKDGFVEMGFPSFYVIDQEGIVQFKTSGYDRTEAVGAAITRLVTK